MPRVGWKKGCRVVKAVAVAWRGCRWMAGRVSGEEKGQIEKKRREIGSKRKNEKSAKGRPVHTREG